VFSISFWSSGFKLIRRVLAMLLTDKKTQQKKSKLLRWERIKSGKGFSVKQMLILEQSCNDLDCC